MAKNYGNNNEINGGNNQFFGDGNTVNNQFGSQSLSSMNLQELAAEWANSKTIAGEEKRKRVRNSLLFFLAGIVLMIIGYFLMRSEGFPSPSQFIEGTLNDLSTQFLAAGIMEIIGLACTAMGVGSLQTKNEHEKRHLEQMKNVDDVARDHRYKTDRWKAAKREALKAIEK